MKKAFQTEYTDEMVRVITKAIETSKELSEGYARNHTVIIEIVENGN